MSIFIKSQTFQKYVKKKGKGKINIIETKIIMKKTVCVRQDMQLTNLALLSLVVAKTWLVIIRQILYALNVVQLYGYILTFYRGAQIYEILDDITIV